MNYRMTNRLLNFVLISVFQAMLDKEFYKDPIFYNLRSLSLERCFLDESDGSSEVKAIERGPPFGES